jgi:branched-chain amino acid transport system substrate-binding protein
MERRSRTLALAALLACLLPPAAHAAPAAAAGKPVLVGLDAEFGYTASTSAEAIRLGIQIAIDEINREGGVLGGRPLALEERANHSVPARSIENIKELAALPDLVAVYCGRFSPTVLESLPTIHSLGLPLLDPWGAADAIVDNGYSPNFAFRLSLRDSWAVPVMLRHAESRGLRRVGLLLLNTSWGRSNLKAAEEYAARHPRVKLTGTHWFNWNDATFVDKYRSLLAGGAQAVVLVANANEAAVLLREVAALPPAERVPVISHWGVAGGTLGSLAAEPLRTLDFSVVQTYSFIGDERPIPKAVAAAAVRRLGLAGVRGIPSQVGVAHAYDLTRILALAVDRAGSTDRRAIRDALEQVGPYRGLIKTYARPFTPQRHEALAPEDVFMAVYARDGALERIAAPAARGGGAPPP